MPAPIEIVNDYRLDAVLAKGYGYLSFAKMALPRESFTICHCVGIPAERAWPVGVEHGHSQAFAARQPEMLWDFDPDGVFGRDKRLQPLSSDECRI